MTTTTNELQDRWAGLLYDAAQTPSGLAIARECLELAELLVEKNRAYGDSALNPIRVFSKATPVEQILVRIDDKLSRLARGTESGEDTVKDLLGYLILLRVGLRRPQDAEIPGGRTEDAHGSVRAGGPGRADSSAAGAARPSIPDEENQRQGVRGDHCNTEAPGSTPAPATEAGGLTGRCQECQKPCSRRMAVCESCYLIRWGSGPRTAQTQPETLVGG